MISEHHKAENFENLTKPYTFFKIYKYSTLATKLNCGDKHHKPVSAKLQTITHWFISYNVHNIFKLTMTVNFWHKLALVNLYQFIYYPVWRRFLKNSEPHMLFWTISTYKLWEEELYCCRSEVNLCHVNDTILTVTKSPLCCRRDIRDTLGGMSLQLAYCFSHNALKDILAFLCQSFWLLGVHMYESERLCVFSVCGHAV